MTEVKMEHDSVQSSLAMSTADQQVTNRLTEEMSSLNISEDNMTESRSPTVHPVECAPKCEQCAQTNKQLFDFECTKCVELLDDQRISISQLMAIVRQWTPSVQCKVDLLVHKMLKRGAHPDDRDELTDMTMLHYVCKSGTNGMGKADKSLQAAIHLVEIENADPNLCCRWNGMTALHIATYFDVACIVSYLVTKVDPAILDQPCASSRYSMTPLHIAASNLCLDSVRVLLSAGANVLLKDKLNRTPLDAVPDDEKIDSTTNQWCKRKYQEIALELSSLLEEATLSLSGEQNNTDMETLKTAKVVLSALGLEIGDRVIVGNAKVGTLRYCGPTQFATGIWTGVELDEPIGKNDGSIEGVQYFVCPPQHGIFAPLNKICKLDPHEYDSLSSLPGQYTQYSGQSNGGKYHHHHHHFYHHHTYSSSGVDLYSVPSRIDTGLGTRKHRFSEANGFSSSSSSVNSEDVHIGSRVFLTDKKSGIVRFIGMTQFASGIWYGIELTRPLGKNDGSVQNVRYFHCADQYGIFVQFPRISRLLPATSTRKTISASHLQRELSHQSFESDETSSDMSMTISGTSSLDYALNSIVNIAKTQETPAAPVPLRGNKSPSINTNISALRRSLSLHRNTRTVNRNSIEQTGVITNRGQSWLRIGVNVLVNGMVATVRYIGSVHFTDGIFLGVELRTPNGKNDGTIDGIRYFSCKPNHGLLVRPKKVTVRGINASKLLPETTTTTTTTAAAALDANGNVGK